MDIGSLQGNSLDFRMALFKWLKFHNCYIVKLQNFLLLFSNEVTIFYHVYSKICHRYNALDKKIQLKNIVIETYPCHLQVFF